MAGSAATRPEINGTCFSGDFCTWQLFDGGGGFLFKFACNSPVNFPSSWLSGRQGSYWNHQTGGAHAFVYEGLNGTGTRDISPAVGSLVEWPWGANPIDRSFVACH
jgi:hypothetical protein